MKTMRQLKLPANVTRLPAASVRLLLYKGTRRHKYGAQKTVVDGITFASKAEAARYGELRMLERGKAIRDLTLQPRFPLVVNGRKVGTYVADFAYHGADDVRVVEDVKGVRTPVYLLKRKLFEALYGLTITET
jgi:hypothetical protein